MTEHNKLETRINMNPKVATTTGKTERHNAAAPAEHGKPSWLAIAIVLVGIGAIATFAGSGSPEVPAPAIVQPPKATLPTPEVVKPTPTNNDTQNSNRNHADHGSVNINGDRNRVNIDNSNRPTTVIHHHHHHTTTTEAPKVEPVRTVLVRTTELRRDNVTPECNQHMANHHRKLAEWYDELAAGK